MTSSSARPSGAPKERTNVLLVVCNEEYKVQENYVDGQEVKLECYLFVVIVHHMTGLTVAPQGEKAV